MAETPTERPATVLVAVQLPEVGDEQHAANLAELGRLVHTLGYEVVATLSQRRSGLAHVAVLGGGKLEELAAMTGGTGNMSAVPAWRHATKARVRREAALEGALEEAADEAEESEDEDDGHGPVVAPSRTPTVVVVDHEITPSQARNLERATGAEVLDRTGVIVEIFHRHARSREARLQVELARLAYVTPRLREGVGSSERQRGRGAGERQLELDKRKVRDRMAELREELAAVAKEQGERRAQRAEARRVALVGYTNAGKSSLMRALTGSQVYVADKLFATLDTTVRALHPEVRPRILVSDTVGFIQKLPHDLVASFRSTLDEALEASLLLYVADASDPTFRRQLQVTQEVLAEIGAAEVPSRLLLNKTDCLDEAACAALRVEFPEAVLLSAKRPEDVAMLREQIMAHFEQLLEEAELVVPYAKQALVSSIHESARVVSEEYDEVGARLRVCAEPAMLARLRRLVEA
jgi:GTP-binding protein HflX